MAELRRIIFFLILCGPTAAFSFTGVSFYGDLLYWKGQCAELEIKHFEEDPFCVSIQSQSRSIDPSIGFRVGANYALCFNRLVFDANFAHYRSKMSENEWKVDLYQGTMAYTLYQYWCIYCDGILGIEGTNLRKDHSCEELFEHNHFSGVGPLFGAGLFLDFGWGFGFEGKGSLSCLYGCRDFRFELLSEPVLKDHSSEHHFMGVSDVKLGLRWWVPWFSCYQFGLWLGWEHHAFLGNHSDDHRSLHFGGDNSIDYNFKGHNRTLILHGLTFSTELSF